MADGIFIGQVTIENFLIFFLLFIMTMILSNLIYTIIRKLFDQRLTRRLSKTIAKLMQYVVMVSGISYGIYNILGLDLTALGASLGIIGIAVAFSSQQIIQNLMSGIIIGITRPLQVEDWITVGGFPSTGISKVKEITLTYTILRDEDGKLIYMPNSSVMSSKILNYTKAGFLEINVDFIVPYNSDIEGIRQTVIEVANRNQRILPNVTNKEKPIIAKIFELGKLDKLFEESINLKSFSPKVLIKDISDNKIKLSIRIWIREIDKKDEIMSEFLETLLKKFKGKK
ncbi:MAG: mechanosensitive ion channel domain-containing protein [Candidatus Woesearchaeota archaeon]